MEPVFFVMAILGCGDAQEMCTEVRVEPTRYATIQQCRAAAPAALARHTDLSYPVISAACRRDGMEVAVRGVAALHG